MAQSTTEDEFVPVTSALNQTMWIRKIFSDLNMEKNLNTEVHVDNQDAISISHNQMFYEKTNQFNVNRFFLRDVEKKGEVILFQYKCEDQLVDVFNLSLPISKFDFRGTNLEFLAPNARRSIS